MHLLSEHIRIFLGTDLTSFFYRALVQTSWGRRAGKPPFVCYYEFGVGSGTYLSQYIKALKAFCSSRKEDIYLYHIFGFDSFEGLPEKKSKKDDCPRWHKGMFSYSLSDLEQKVTKHGIDLKRQTVHFIKGFFEKTLTPDLRKALHNSPPSIGTVHFHCY
jgi:hypothetical protein